MVDLKHYDAYMTILKRLARVLRIRVTFGDAEGDAWWSPPRRLLKIDSSLSESDTIAAFLHELGHSFDDTLALNTERSVSRAYDSYYKDKHTRRQWELVIHREKSAWRFARIIAKMSGIKLGKWFYRYERQCLGAYKP